MYGETFYSRHTAQHQLQWSQNKSITKIEFCQNKDTMAPNGPLDRLNHSKALSGLRQGTFQTNIHIVV